MKGLSFKLGGIPVTVDPSFLVIAAMFGIGGGSLALAVTWVPVVFVSVLIHELGHAVAFRIYGQEPRVVLQGMGGLTYGSAGLPFGRDIVVSLAGPLTGMILLGLPAYLLEHAGPTSGTAGLVTREVVFANVVWSVVNLLPVLPLDGGNVAASLLRRFKGPDGQQAARVLSFVIAGVAGLYAYQIGFTFGTLFALFFAVPNFVEWRKHQQEGEQEPLIAGYRALVGNDLGTATRVADEVLATKPGPAVAASAVELKAWAGFCAGGAAAANAALEAMPDGATTNRFLTGSLALDAGRTSEALDDFAEAFSRGQSGPWSIIVAEAVARCGLVGDLADRLVVTPGAGADALAHLQSHLHGAGRFPEAAFTGQRAFDAGPDHPSYVAYDVACSWARAAEPDHALDWLERSADAGLVEPTLLEKDADLTSIRSTPRFEAVLARMRAAKDDRPPLPPPPPLAPPEL